MITNDYTNKSYSPAFQASLNVRSAVKDVKRLKNIERLFEEKTLHYKGDTLKIKTPADNPEGLHATIIGNNRDVSALQILPRSFNEMLDELSDNDIAKKLVKLFKSIKLEEKSYKKVFALKNKVGHLNTLADFNASRAERFEANGDMEFANRYRAIADKNRKQAARAEKELLELKNHTGNVLEKIADGDKDLMKNFELVSSVSEAVAR